MGTNVTSAGNLGDGRPVSQDVTASFESFYQGTSPRLLRYAYGLTGDMAEAQDFTQEAYTRAWQRWKRLKDYDNPESWLRLVVTRLATDRWRWLGLRRNQPPQEAHRIPPPDETLMDLVAELKLLPMEQRRALVLHYLLDRPVAEIAAETGTNINTVKSWLARGRTNLAAQMIDAQALPSADAIAGKGKSRRKRNNILKSIAAFMATATAATAAAAWLAPGPAPKPPANPKVVLTYGAPIQFAFTAASGDRSYTTWIDTNQHQWIAAVDLQAQQPVWKPVDMGEFGDTNGFEVSAQVVLMLTEQGAEFDGDALVAFDPASGERRWALPYSFNEDERLLYDDTLLIGFHSGKTEAIDVRTGRPKWTMNDPLIGMTPIRSDTEFQWFNGSGPPPAKERKVVLVLADGSVQVRDIDTGAVLHERQAQLEASDGRMQLMATDNTLYSASPEGVTAVPLSGSGAVRRLPLNIGQVVTPPVPCGQNLICVVNPSSLLAIDTQTGTERFRVPAKQGGIVSVSRSGILVSGREGSYLYDPAGKPLLEKKTRDLQATWLDENHLITIGNGAVTKVSVPDGKETPLNVGKVASCGWNAVTISCTNQQGVIVLSLD